jgi:hypothetical protein
MAIPGKEDVANDGKLSRGGNLALLRVKEPHFAAVAM